MKKKIPTPTGSLLIAMIGAAALLAALAVAGCGGGGADPLPKAEFTKQANAICVHAAKERETALSAAVKEGEGEPSEEIIEEAAVPPTKEMVEELDGLGAPKGDEKQVETMITQFEEGIEKVEANPKEALGSRAFVKANESAVSLGLTECAI